MDDHDCAERTHVAFDALEAAYRAYSAIYRIRRSYFQPTHVGLGTWGRYLPISERDQERIRPDASLRVRANATGGRCWHWDHVHQYPCGGRATTRSQHAPATFRGAEVPQTTIAV